MALERVNKETNCLSSMRRDVKFVTVVKISETRETKKGGKLPQRRTRQKKRDAPDTIERECKKPGGALCEFRAANAGHRNEGNFADENWGGGERRRRGERLIKAREYEKRYPLSVQVSVVA